MSQSITEKSFRSDSVPHFTPISFSIEFIKEMRKEREIINFPSLRTTISIPKFLSARYFRKESLDPSDYLESAVYNTPYEDQKIARKVAYRLLFPETEELEKIQENKSKKKSTKSDHQNDITGLDIMLSELAELGLEDLSKDFDEDAFNDLLDQEMKAWDYTNQLENSNNPKSQAIQQLLVSLSHKYGFIEHGISNNNDAINFLNDRLTYQAGAWPSSVFSPACTLNLTKTLEKHAQMPWEVATSMGLAGHPEFENYLNDCFENLSPKAIGKILRYLTDNGLKISQDQTSKAFQNVKTLQDHLELLRALGRYLPAKDDVYRNSMHQIKSSLDASESIYKEFLSPVNFEQNPLSDKLYKFWRENYSNPNLDETLNSTYDDNLQTWEKNLLKATNSELKNKSPADLANLAKQLKDFNSHRMSSNMKHTQNQCVQKLVNEAINSTTTRENFLATMKTLSNANTLPSIQEAIKSGKRFNVPDERIQEFYNNPVEVMKSNIEHNVTDLGRYNPLIDKIKSLSGEDMYNMMSKATKNGNHSAMSSLAAINMGSAFQMAERMQMPDGSKASDSLVNVIDKSAGGGENLIKQWFIHRNSIPPNLKLQLKSMIKQVLIEIAREWANKFVGNTEEGVVPITLSRPFKPSDDFDNLDVDSTIESILAGGKSLRSITGDDLMIHEVKKGRTAFCVLIDISGSMSGGDLAMCAIGVCMILMKMNSEEVSIALFESDTHVIKEFDKGEDLEEVVDQILELQARGGTRVDAALKWATSEMEKNTESQVKILYLLSDFYFSETLEEVGKHCSELAQQEVRILATSHGRDNNRMKQLMIDKTDGQGMKLTTFKDLPSIIADAINSIQ